MTDWPVASSIDALVADASSRAPVAYDDSKSGARFERIAECGHLSTIEQPERVSKILVDWLAQSG